MSDRIFLDTSGLLSLFDTSERSHSLSNEIFVSTNQLFTTNYVITEFFPLTESRGLRRDHSIEFTLALSSLSRLVLVWIDQRLHDSAVNLLQVRLDKSYSLCDAVSFVVMRENGIDEALTTDKHFEQEGFLKLLK